jgi:putative heme-binding domain-containing protein
LADAGHPDAAVRLGILLALRRAGYERPEDLLKIWLRDDSEAVRKQALAWIGEAGLTSLLGELKQAVARPPASADLLDTYLATLQALEPEARAAVAKQIPGFQIKWPSVARHLDALVLDSAAPTAVRARAVALVDHLDGPARQVVRRELVRLANGEEATLRAESIRTLAQFPDPPTYDLLAAVAKDRRRPADLRADAVQGLAGDAVASVGTLLALLDDPEARVRSEAARSLRPAANDAKVRPALEAKWAARLSDAVFAEQLAFALFRDANGPPRPKDDAQWRKAVAEGGDVAAGRRVFFDRTLNCAGCHRVQGRGGQIGPDLTTLGRTVSRERILDSILRPSAEIAPEFQPYTVQMKAGQTHNGLQFHFRGKAVTLLVQDGLGMKEIRFALDDIESYGVSDKSLMPEGLEKQMSVTDLRNLLAFLATAREQ